MDAQYDLCAGGYIYTVFAVVLTHAIGQVTQSKCLISKLATSVRLVKQGFRVVELVLLVVAIQVLVRCWLSKWLCACCEVCQCLAK